MSSLLAMHATDGLFSMPVNVLFAVIVASVVGAALLSLARRGDHRLAPVMGVMAAFVFAAQMVNFPIAAGTTGHLLGGTLAAILLGPWAGTVVMAVVIIFQAVLGDGGLTVLGPNIFNMGIVGTCLAYYVYRAIVGRDNSQPGRVVAGGFFAAWLSVVLASVFVSLELAISGRGSLDRVLPAMVLVHMAIGIGEALITAGVLAFILKTRPALLYDRSSPAPQAAGRAVIVLGLAASLVVGVFLSLLPALWESPDGLEYVGIQKGILFEDCQRADNGALKTLPAYPLGVKLEMAPTGLTAVHQYANQAGKIEVGDVLQSVNGVPTPDLAAAAVALKFNAEAKTFGVKPGDVIDVVLDRAGRRQALSVTAAGAPQAGTKPPLIALLPDYTVPGIDGMLSTSLAGGIGTIVVFLLSFVVGRAFTRPGRLEAAFSRTAAAGNEDRSG
ncbi:MAG TPA: energy-coupling factor ABC transporter permease [Phycisphaerae bacterium]|nr:energy-coupling factor ABC transporter permease [Phycisphaerae bacterium]